MEVKSVMQQENTEKGTFSVTGTGGEGRVTRNRRCGPSNSGQFQVLGRGSHSGQRDGGSKTAT